MGLDCRVTATYLNKTLTHIAIYPIHLHMPSGTLGTYATVDKQIKLQLILVCVNTIERCMFWTSYNSQQKKVY